MIITGKIKLSGNVVIAPPIPVYYNYTTLYFVSTVTNYTVLDSAFTVTPLLLNGETATPNWISDASTLTNAITTAGNVVSNRFSPVWPVGYYSNYFTTSSNYLAIPLAASNVIFPSSNTGGFTIEFWIYPAPTGSTWTCIPVTQVTGSVGANWWELDVKNSGLTLIIGVFGFTSFNIQNSVPISPNQWTHIVVQRRNDGSTWDFYYNGVGVSLAVATGQTANLNSTNPMRWGAGFNAVTANFYLSNFRISSTQVYSSNFTPSTQPLTATTQTAILTCLGPNFTDYSINNAAMTVTGPVSVQSQQPFGSLSSTSTNYTTGYYSNYFSGSSAYLAGASTLTNASIAATIECWFYLTGSYGGYVVMFSSMGSGGSGFQFGINANGYLSFGRGNGGAGTTAQYTTAVNLYTWYHVAGVRTSGGAMTIYLNGVSVATASDSVATANSQWVIGRGYYDLSTNYFPGYISNLRVVSGTAVYNSNFTPPTQPLTAIPGTVLLACQSAQLVDTSSYANTLSNFNGVTVSVNTPLTAPTTTTNVISYGSGLFDGSSGYLTIPAGNAFAIGSSADFTIECWIYTTSSATQRILSAANAFDFLLVNSGSNVWLNFYDGTDRGTSSNYVPQNAWVHVAAVRKSGTLTLYCNGVVFNTPASSSAANSNSQSFLIGRYGPSATQYFVGYIANFRIVNGTALYTSNFYPSNQPLSLTTGTTLLTLQNRQSHNNNVFYDDSPNNFAITRVGSPTQGSFSPFGVEGWSNYFDGSTGYVIAASPNLIGSWTVEFWAYWTVGATQTTMVSFNNGSYSGINIWKNTSNQLVIDDGVNAQSAFTGGTVTINAWNHIAYVRNGTVTTAYINGVSVGTNSSFTPSTTSYISIGRYNAPTYFYFPGYISNLRVTNGAAVYTTSTFTPSVVSLTAATGTTGTVALLTAQSNRFVDNSTFSNTLTVTGSVSVQPISPFLSTASYSTSLVGGSMYFNGSTDYLVNTSSPAVANFGTGDFTWEAWLYINSTNTTSEWEIFEAQPTSGAFQVYRSTSNALSYGAYGVTGNNTTPVNQIPIFQWFHLAISRTSGSVTTYINGVKQATYTDTTNYSQTGITIGGRNTGVNFFPGYISNLRIIKGTGIYTTAFTPPTAPPQPVSYVTSSTTASTSLLLLGTNAGVVDQTGRSNLITAGIASIANSSTYVKYGNGALSFNGSSYTSIPYGPSWVLAGNFTIECWLYWSAHGSYGGIVGNANNNTGAAISAGWYLDFNSTSNNLQFEGQGSVSIVTTNVIPQNQWVHIAVVRSGSTITHYLNGVANGSGTSSQVFNSASYPLYVGVDRGATSYLTGYIDDLRITNGTARYTTNFTPPSQALPTLGQTGTTVVTTTTAYVITGTYLIVAGGGGGSSRYGGGGGAGGLLSGTTALTSGSSYAITVGSGGTGNTTSGAVNTGTSGGNSTAFSLTAIGGGGGGGGTNGPGIAGGSGGGATEGGSGGSGTPGQGYAGGSATPTTNFLAAGGGGAGGLGGNAISGQGGGIGGTGTTTTIISTATSIALGIGQYVTATNAIYFAGGGGGGSFQGCGGQGGAGGVGGLGGGGSGAGSAVGTAGLAYSGGGGGGGANSNGGYTGGSGVVIVAYPSSTQLASGGIVTTSTIAGTAYFQHIFTASGTLTMTPPIIYTANYLVVGGGGGGGGNYAGGGGAGGLLSGATSLTSGVSYSITVGTGGAGGGTNSGGASGTNSVAFGLTAIGGGGGSICAVAGLPGGSGGGAGGDGNATGGLGTPGQGYSGGTTTGYHPGGGGGGGAGGPGANVCGTSNAGNGGTGTTTTIISTTTAITIGVGQYITATNAVYFAGGGGGGGYNYYSSLAGVGGFGGGGNGAASGSGPSNVGLPALPYTGGGGGGGGGSYGPGGAGGSGVVIISVPTASWSGTYTGTATVVTTVGTSTVLIFKASGTFTA